MNSLNRRRALKLGASSTLLFLAGCMPTTTAQTGTGESTNTGSSASCPSSVVPSETAGPYPANGSNTNGNGITADVFDDYDIYRQDITDGRSGVPLSLTLTILDLNCSPIVNAAVYIWHCDKDGAYSAYKANSNSGGSDLTQENFLRGIQVTDTNGQVTFNTIYPGWYTGRITHIHFSVYANDTLNSNSLLKTSQIAFPTNITTAVYSSSQYSAHGQNSSVTNFSSDNIFSDGTTYQMANVSGSVSSGYSAHLTFKLNA